MLTKTDDASNTLFSDRYQQTYHSTFGALTESQHVFLHGSGVYDRLQAKLPTRVLEIGFGLGLNFLLCADQATTAHTLLDYTGIEHAPINADSLKNLNYGQWLKAPTLADDLARVYSKIDELIQPADLELDKSQQQKHEHRPTVTDTQRTSHEQTGFAYGAIGQYSKLTLHINEATSSTLIQDLKTAGGFDAIFLDAFSPEVNPECWTQEFFTRLSQLLKSEGKLATYCVKGSVRRNLVAAGFSVNKYPGPKGKREVLWANLAAPLI